MKDDDILLPLYYSNEGGFLTENTDEFIQSVKDKVEDNKRYLAFLEEQKTKRDSLKENSLSEPVPSSNPTKERVSEVLDYRLFFKELASHHLDEIINHCVVNNINFDDYDQSVIDTNQGDLVYVDFKAKRKI